MNNLGFVAFLAFLLAAASLLSAGDSRIFGTALNFAVVGFVILARRLPASSLLLFAGTVGMIDDIFYATDGYYLVLWLAVALMLWLQRRYDYLSLGEAQPRVVIEVCLTLVALIGGRVVILSQDRKSVV